MIDHNSKEQFEITIHRRRNDDRSMANNLGNELNDGFNKIGIKSSIVKVDYTKKEHSKKMIIVKDVIRDKFFLITVRDSHMVVTKYSRYLSDPKCVCCLHCQFRKFDNMNEKIVPFTFYPKIPKLFEIASLNLLKTNKKHLNTISYLGNAGIKRKKILDLLKKNCNIFIGNKFFHIDYLHILYHSDVGLSLPGCGNFCHREIECFGLKTPVIMPRLLNRHYNKLIPDYHYVGVNVDWDHDSEDAIGDAIIEKYNSIKDDYDFLYGIANNAYKWYENNVKLPNLSKLAYKIYRSMLR
jgi:hypothetical protein